jgi:hypothetical protein
MNDPIMTQSMEMTKDERERLWSERMEITIGGVELSSSLINTPKGKNVEIFHDSVFKDEGEHQWMMDISSILNAMCQNIIAGMDDEAKERLYQLVEQDNGKARPLYRLVMTRKLAGTGKKMLRISDYIDPDFRRLDPGVVERAAEIRKIIMEEALTDTSR